MTRGVVFGLLLAGCAGEDRDGDGWSTLLDCNDELSGIHPTALEVCDGVDNDCDGLIDLGAIDASAWYPDADGDGAGDPLGKVWTCQAPAGAVNVGGDCDDTNRFVHPDAVEVCNGVDDDCDHLIDEDTLAIRLRYHDFDFDGHGDPLSIDTACVPSPSSVAEGDDCDDTDRDIHPGADEICDGVDQDCDELIDEDPVDAPAWYPDADLDGYGWIGLVQYQCEAPSGWIAATGDCNDFDPASYPGAPERCDGLDNDCDGVVDGPTAVDPVTWYLDADGDGFGSTTTMVGCDPDPGYVALPGDCDDLLPSVNPFAPEVCPNGQDDDCNGLVDECP